MTTERWPDEFRGHICLDVVIEVSLCGSLAALTVGLVERSGDLVEWCRSGLGSAVSSAGHGYTPSLSRLHSHRLFSQPAVFPCKAMVMVAALGEQYICLGLSPLGGTLPGQASQGPRACSEDSRSFPSS